ncbi:hypothetical protein GE09DRAFT_1139312 [Coniochaeta sp. 2T2.1]|nr:hypothetical protein GE09DRAFT_1139312 [Coniochaeta sp. 2T2.1]
MSRLQDLPTLHPSLTLHLSDKADTPIISSAPLPPPLTPSQSQSQPHQSSSALSPPQSQQPRSHHPRPTRSAAIASLNRSALASYAAAARFGLGNPVRIMVECVPTYPRTVSSSSAGGGGSTVGGATTKGPVVLNTYIPPLPLPQPAAAAVAQANGTEGIESRLQRTGISQQGTSPGAAGIDTGEDVDGDGDASNRPPLLVAVVVAPDGESQTVADARLAASRLARVGRRLQAQWAEEDGGQNGEG